MIKKQISSALFKLVKELPISFLYNFVNSKILFPFYHTVSDDDLPHIKNLYKYRSINEFRNDLDYLLKDRIPIDLETLINILKGKTTLQKKAFFLSFDDGLSEIYSIVSPILKEKGVPATFFLCPEFIDNKELFFRHKVSLIVDVLKSCSPHEFANIKKLCADYKINSTKPQDCLRKITFEQSGLLNEFAEILNFDFKQFITENNIYLTSEQVNSLIENGFDIGAHSNNHPHYSELSIDEQVEQTKTSINYLNEKYSINCRAFAFPFNDIGVSNAFFQKLQVDKIVDITFGTAGFFKDSIQYNIQRFSMEEYSGTIEEIIKQYIYQRIKRTLNGSGNFINR